MDRDTDETAAVFDWKPISSPILVIALISAALFLSSCRNLDEEDAGKKGGVEESGVEESNAEENGSEEWQTTIPQGSSAQDPVAHEPSERYEDSPNFAFYDVTGDKSLEVLLVQGESVTVIGNEGRIIGTFSSPIESGVLGCIGDYDKDGKADFLYGTAGGAKPELVVVNGMGNIISCYDFAGLSHGSSFFLPLYMDGEHVYVLTGEKWPDDPRGLYAFNRPSGEEEWFFVLPQGPVGFFAYRSAYGNVRQSADRVEDRFLFSLQTRDTGVFNRVGSEHRDIKGTDSELRLVETNPAGKMLNYQPVGGGGIPGTGYVLPVGEGYALARVPLQEESMKIEPSLEFSLLSRDGEILRKEKRLGFSFLDMRLLHGKGRDFILLLDRRGSVYRLSSYDQELRLQWSLERKAPIVVAGAGRGILPVSRGGRDLPTVVDASPPEAARLPVIAVGREVYLCTGSGGSMSMEDPLAVREEPVEACSLLLRDGDARLYTFSGGVVSSGGVVAGKTSARKATTSARRGSQSPAIP